MEPKRHQREVMSREMGKSYPLPAAYSVLVIIGAVLALALLSGCASAPVGGASDLFEYNPNTGYPAVGSMPWR